MPNEQARLKREFHKRKLLEAWREAVQGKDADQALEILTELDPYLKPAEATKLKESASEMFHIKLRTLGKQFSLSVTKRDWEQSLKIGKEIIQYFPNSRMASEIQSKLPILETKVNQITSKEKSVKETSIDCLKEKIGNHKSRNNISTTPPKSEYAKPKLDLKTRNNLARREAYDLPLRDDRPFMIKFILFQFFSMKT